MKKLTILKKIKKWVTNMCCTHDQANELVNIEMADVLSTNEINDVLSIVRKSIIKTPITTQDIILIIEMSAILSRFGFRVANLLEIKIQQMQKTYDH